MKSVPIEDPTMQDKLLNWAEVNKATVKALWKKVNNYLSFKSDARRILARIKETKTSNDQALSDVRNLARRRKSMKNGL